MPSPQNMAFQHTLNKTRLLLWLSYLLDFILYNSVLPTTPSHTTLLSVPSFSASVSAKFGFICNDRKPQIKMTYMYCLFYPQIKEIHGQVVQAGMVVP